MSAVIRGAQPPAGPSEPVYHVLAPERGACLDVLVLDERITGVDCHWVKGEGKATGRSVACEAWRGDCPHHDQRRLWLGFVGVLDLGDRRTRKVLRLGAESAKDLAGRAVQFGGVRGQTYRVRRPADGDTRRVLFEVCPISYGRDVPRPHALRATLCAVLGTDALPDYEYTAADLAEKGGAE